MSSDGLSVLRTPSVVLHSVARPSVVARSHGAGGVQAARHDPLRAPQAARAAYCVAAAGCSDPCSGWLTSSIAVLSQEKVGSRRPDVLVAWQHWIGYAAGMRWRTDPSLGCRMGRLTRMLMLALGIVSVPSVGPAAMQRHDPAAVPHEAHSGGRHRVPEPTQSTSWQEASEHACPHCPATDCARIAPCTTSSNAAIAVASLTVTQTATRRVIARRVRVHPYSTTHRPPVPPPQLIS